MNDLVCIVEMHSLVHAQACACFATDSGCEGGSRMRSVRHFPGKGLVAQGSLLEGLLEESEETDPGQPRGGSLRILVADLILVRQN